MELTERELKEVRLALFYESECNHGTAGHNRLLLIAKLARALGYAYAIGEDEFLMPSDER